MVAIRSGMVFGETMRNPLEEEAHNPFHGGIMPKRVTDFSRFEKKHPVIWAEEHTRKAREIFSELFPYDFPLVPYGWYENWDQDLGL